MKAVKKLSAVVSAICCVAVIASGVGCKRGGGDVTGPVTEIVVDGGGANAVFNSTKSMMYDKYANPYPYNTLEKLGEEWSKLNPGYKIKVASSSMNNDRETMVPALNQGTAPDILFYLVTTVAEDMNKGWFVELNDYMEKPNKYSKEGEAGSVKWKDIYSEEEYGTTLAPNGKKFTVELEKNAIGIIYNKTIFAAAGITSEPQTFKELMEAQDKINAYAKTIDRADNTAADYLTPYYPYYPWYDGCLESALYGEYLEYWDVLNKNGVMDAQEVARAYMTKDENGTRLYSPDGPRAVEKARLVKVLTKYYPAAFESYYAEQQFTSGNLVMMEAQGGTMRKLIDTVDGKFEIGVFSYPILEQQPEGEPENEYYTKYNVDRYVRRGLSGYSTGWGVTKTAMNKGDAVVEKCVDFLQFVTCYENNDRLINDKGFSIPLSGNTNYDYFRTLSSQYTADSANKKTLAWSAVTPGGCVNKSYYDAVYLMRIEIIKEKDSSKLQEKLSGLTTSLQQALNTLYKQNSWDRNSWPAYDGPAID